MAFKPKTEDGKVDPSINMSGRPRITDAPKKPSNRSIRERELLTLLRKIKPLVADSIGTAARIMNNDKASEQNQLKAAVILLDNYKELVHDLYNIKYDEEEAEEVQQDSVPLFSLKVVNGDQPQ